MAASARYKDMVQQKGTTTGSEWVGEGSIGTYAAKYINSSSAI